MRRTILGVPFIVHSPSFLVLDARDDGSSIDHCQLWYTGHEWLMQVRMKHGAHHLRQFPSRDFAIEAMGGHAA
jgi:hypothetical protein